MHPYYGPSARALGESRGPAFAGLVSMAAYLAFWALALGAAKREVDARFPRQPRRAEPDPALAVLRERFARGEIDADQLQAMVAVLRSVEVQHGQDRTRGASAEP